MTPLIILLTSTGTKEHLLGVGYYAKQLRHNHFFILTSTL